MTCSGPFNLRFGEGAHVDWWVLLLSGPGTFVAAKDSAESWLHQGLADVWPVLAPHFDHCSIAFGSPPQLRFEECADISRMLPHLPSAKLAPCFGHAWMEAARVPELPKSVELMGGLQRRVGEAVEALTARRFRG